MSEITFNELALDAERQFQAALGPSFATVSREVFGESNYRGGFSIMFAAASGKVQVSYGDLELEVTFKGKKLFGPGIHKGFAGNMFTREHLKQNLPVIAANSVGQLGVAG